MNPSTFRVLNPTILFHEVNRVLSTFHVLLFNYGFYASRSVVQGGLWVRHSLSGFDAVIAMVGLKLDRFKVGYSYDLTVSRLTNEPGGSHEISFIMRFNCPVKKVAYRTVNCPDF